VAGGNSTVGTISSTGVYTAPNAVPATNPVSITATSTQDTTQSGSASVTITAPAPTITAVAAACAPTSVATGGSSQCTATVTGTGAYSSTVAWSVGGVAGGNATVGTITSAGVYTAPAAVPVTNPVTVTATSTANTAKTGTAMVTIVGTLESSTQNITAASGGTITLSNGSSVTIPGGALKSDYSVTLSLVTGLAPQPPSGFMIGTGDALVLTTSTPPFNTVTGNLQFTIASGSNSAGLSQSAGLADLIDSTGDNFFGVPGTFSSTTNLGTVTVAAALMNGTNSVVVSMSNLQGPYTGAPAAGTTPEAASDRGSQATPEGFTAPVAGPHSWDGSSWGAFDGCTAPPGSTVLVLVHGMASSVEDAYGNNGNLVSVNGNDPDYCVNQIKNAAGKNDSGDPYYGQVVGFDYDWTDAAAAGAQFATFLDTLAACGNNIDIEAHSEGGPVAATGVTLAGSAARNLITNFIGLGNPWDGTPAASAAGATQGFSPFTTVLMNSLLIGPGIVAQYVPFLEGVTIQTALSSPFVQQLEPNSTFLDQIQQNLGPKAPNMKMTLACGNAPSGLKLRATQAMGTLFSSSDGGFSSNDGIVSVPSCKGMGPTGTGNVFTGITPDVLAPYALSHTQLACDPKVIEDVGNKIHGVSPALALVATPSSIAFPNEVQGFTGAVPNQSLAITSTGAELAWTATLSSGASSWLSISPENGTTPTTPSVSAIVGNPGTYTATITLSATGVTSISVPVTFTVTPETFDLLAESSVTGTGSGTVTPDPAGTSCGTDCYTYNAGTSVVITASPSTGSTFTGWSGACSGTGSCTVVMNSNLTATATFNATAATYDLQLGTSGTGSGTVTPSPAGTNCGSGCYAYTSGATVQVAEAPGTDSTFTGWSGACSGTGACSVTMSGNKTVTGAFASSSGGGSIAGAWGGDMTESFSGCNYAGTMTWSINQTGTALSGFYAFSDTLTSGDINVCGATESYSDTFTGSISGTTISLLGDADGEVFTATVSGSTITGTMTGTGGSAGVSFTYTLTAQ